MDSPFVHDVSSASPVDSPCVHDISSASPVDPPCLHIVSSTSPVDLLVAVAYAPRYYRRCGIEISIFYFSICTLCCVNVLHIFALSSTRSAIFVQLFFLILSFLILLGIYGSVRRLTPVAMLLSFGSSPLVANSPISAPSVRLICDQSFDVICHLGSLGTNHISTAPPAVPDSATKYTEATGGLQSDTPFEAPMMESPGVGHCRRLKWISLPHPPFLCLCLCLI